jgi:hypothetical protein
MPRLLGTVARTAVIAGTASAAEQPQPQPQQLAAQGVLSDDEFQKQKASVLD